MKPIKKSGNLNSRLNGILWNHNVEPNPIAVRQAIESGRISMRGRWVGPVTFNALREYASLPLINFDRPRCKICGHVLKKK